MPKISPNIRPINGFRVAGVHAGLKKDGALDFALISSERECTTAGVFTRNKVKAAPVLLNMERLRGGASGIRAVAINTVSANACTGSVGLANARAMSDLVAQRLAIASEQVLVMSTGVIGAHLPMDKIARGVDLASENLGDDWTAAAAGIMTTDTRPKLGSVTVPTSKGQVTLAGIVKGAGMIAPNMATMLSVIVTDASLGLPLAQAALSAASRQSYNRIVVDGDTSTNDMVVLMCNGASGVDVSNESDIEIFQTALSALAKYLAQEVVRDGEGVTKFVTLDIRNAESVIAAERIGQTIGASVLTKSAFYGSDANWGRIIAAAGRAEAPFEPDLSSLYVAAGEAIPAADRSLLIFSQGMPTDYREEDAAAIMAETSIYFTLDCGLGAANATIWTCDISHDYITINGDYRS